VSRSHVLSSHRGGRRPALLLTLLLAAALTACGGGKSGSDSAAPASGFAFGGQAEGAVDGASAGGTTDRALAGASGATQDSGCTTAVAPAPTPDAAATAAFGLSTDASYYTVNTGAGLVFKIRRGNYGASTQAPGDVASLVYKGVEYQSQTAGTQVNAGAGFLYTGVGEDAVTVTAEQVDADHIKVTVRAGDLTHYYLAHRGEAKVYMGTVFASEPNQDSESFIRYIVRAQKDRLPSGPAMSDLGDTNAAIEAADIFATASGQTRSKHYSNQRLRDWNFIGATGSGVGLWVVRGNSEGMSGGPFYRSLLNQGASAEQQLTYIVNYGMAQTEAYRMNVLNTYALVFTDGGTPAAIDTSWYGGMQLKGWVAPAGRGTVSGDAVTGLDSRYRYTVGLSNGAAQYWTTASGAKGGYSCAGVLPGDYTLNVYKNELVVASRPVTVRAGATTQVADIAVADPSADAAVWRIGDWDGTPAELLNGDKVTTMHPTDVRMASWTPGTFTVGTSVAAKGFPAYSAKAVNGTQTVQFTLRADQLLASRIRIGITTAFAGGRPQITLNNWTSAAPAASSQPGTRNLTVGTYRGNNTFYTYDVPASALVAGTNTLKISIISGSSGDGWLSPAVAYDAIDLLQ